MNIYLPSGYVNMRDMILQDRYPFVIVTGGRGTGKTYGALETAKIEKLPFILIRRTQTQVDIIATPAKNPFKKLNRNHHWDITVKSLDKYTYGFFDDDEMIGQAAALSTFANLRGFDASDITHAFYDEFQPEKHQAAIRGEGAALLNVYETINRNRELEEPPEPPLHLIMMSNTNDIANPIFMELDLVNVAARMQERKQLYYINERKGLLIVNLDSSPISARKKKTALGRLIEGTSSEYGGMAFDNEYIDDSIAIIRSRNLRGYSPLVSVAGITIYKHRSNGLYYASEHRAGSPEVYSTASASIEKFRKKYWYLWGVYLNNDIDFESKLCAVIFEKLW